MFWEARKKFIDFSTIVSETKRASFHKKRLKILTAEQMFKNYK